VYKPSPSHQHFLNIITEKNRKNFAIGGGSIVGKDLGTREGFYEPKLVNHPKGEYSVKFPYKQDYGNPRFRGVQYGTKEEIEKLIKDRTTAADASYKKGVGKAAQIAKEKAEADIKKTIDSFIEQGDYENFKTKPYESQLQRKLPSGELRQSTGGRVNPKTFQYIRDMLDAGDYENLSRITGRSKEELISFNEKLPEKGAVDIKLRAQRAGESNPRILTDEERRERGRAAYATRKESESKAKKYASEEDLKDFGKIKQQRKRLNDYFAENPNAINDTDFGKEIKKLMDIRLDKEGNLVYNTRPDSYYVEKAKNKDIFDVFDVTPIKSKKQSTRFPVNLNITPTQFNRGFIEGQVDKYFRKGGRFEGNQEILNKVSNFLDQQGVRVELTDVGRIGAAPGVGVNRATGQFPTIYNTLKKMKIPDELLSDVNPVSKAAQLKESIPGLKLASEIEQPEKSKTRDMYKNAFKGERGFVSTDLLKDVGKGAGKLLTAAGTPLGVVGLTAGFGVDPTSAVDRATVGLEAALAPSLVKGTNQLTKNALLRRLFNLGLSPQAALRVARIASPLGVASLGGEALYQYGKFVKDELERIEKMTPEEREAYNAEQEEQMGIAAANGGLITREAFKDGFDPKKRQTMKILGGLASIPVLGKYVKILGPLAPAVTETVQRGADAVPTFLYDLIAKVKSKGMKFFTGNRADEFEYVYERDGYQVREQGNKITVRKRNEDGEMLDKDMEMELEVDPETGGLTYKEATARPDAEGKLKDVEEYIEDVDLEEMKKYTYDE